MVSFRVSPLDELVALGSENPITRAPSRLAAVSKLSRVRVEGSKKVDREETIAEKTSLSDRFGLRIPYLSMDKAGFLDMVEQMAAQYGIDMAAEELRAKAVAFEERHPGRTPRVARQFIASLSM